MIKFMRILSSRSDSLTASGRCSASCRAGAYIRSGRPRGSVFALLCVAALSLPAGEIRAQGKTTVSIQGDRFFINGTVTHPGTAAEGLLLNSRMVQAIFDDENPQTVGNSAYPDTRAWDPERNVKEFIAALPSYAGSGLRMVTVNLQGGSPGWSKQDNQTGIITAFHADGSLKPAWLDRLDRVIRAADQHGIVVMLGLFYFGQDHRLANEAAVIRAVDGVTDHLLAQGYTNVLVEINNEADYFYNHEILKPGRVAELITRVKGRSGGRLKVTTSLKGGAIPSASIISASDYLLLHGNNQSASGVAGMVDQLRSTSAYQASPKPIVFNEDSTSLQNFDAAVGKRASWGYYDQGQNNYVDGFQSPPVNWTINTSTKRAFFDRVAALTGSGSPPPPTGETRVTSFTLINADTDQPVPGFESLTGTVTLALPGLPTRNLNLRANTSPSTVGSVRFGLDGNSNHLTENTAPYALFGDNNGNYGGWTLGLGTHVVTATPYSGANATGTAGTQLVLTLILTDDATPPPDLTPPSVDVTFDASTGQGQVQATDSSAITRVQVRLDGTPLTEGPTVPLSFTVTLSAMSAGTHVIEALVTDAAGNVGRATTSFSVDPPPSSDLRVTSFTLMNADTDLPVSGYETLTGSVILSLNQMPTANLTLRANTAGSVGSVKFGLDGNANHLVENFPPYSLSGDTNGDYKSWNLGLGVHSITATPFSQANAAGTAGSGLTLALTIVDTSDAPRPPVNVRIIR